MTVNYISNKEFTQAIAEYNELCLVEEEAGREAPVIPNHIAKQFIVLANRLGSRYNFANYSYRDEMVSCAILACCAKIRKFKISVSNNAFAYFTNVCWRAMVDVINLEEDVSYIKAKSFQSMEYDDTLSDNDLSEFGDYSGNVNDYVPFFDVQAYEDKLKAQKEKSKAKAKVKAAVVNDGPSLEVD